NAAKYTKPGGHVRLTADRDGDDAVLRVRDNGVGISPDTLPKVFDLFVQADRSLDRSDGGLGIGLTLVRNLVQMHGGSVHASSEGADRASEFVVRLPLPPEAPQSHQAVGKTTRPNNRSVPGRRILVVDDNVDAAQSLGLLLELSGHEVRTAHDGLVALETAKSFRPDVILLDIGLPRMDGYEVARRIRQEPELKNLVLLALSGYGHEEDRRRSHGAGFDAHLTKPVDLDELQNLLVQTILSPDRNQT